MLVLCCSCGTTLKTRKVNKHLDISYKCLDSLNRTMTIKDITKDIKSIEDNSRIKITKYSPADSAGKQAVDYVVEIEKDVQGHTSREIKKDEVQVEHSAHKEENIDNSVVEIKEEYEEPPAIKGIKHIKGIIALILIAYLVYKFKRN